MAITITSPKQISPVFNPVIWRITTDNSNIVFFRLEVKDYQTGLTIRLTDIFPTPKNPLSSYIDVSSILKDFVEFQISNSDFVKAMEKPIYSYRVKVTEKVYNSVTGLIEDGTVYENTSDLYRVWYAEYDRQKFNDFLLTYNVADKFLTDKPDRCVVNEYSAEMLHFIHADVTNIFHVVKTYDASATLLNNYVNLISREGKSYFQVPASPKSLMLEYAVDFTGVSYYTVQINGPGSVQLSQVRRYDFKPLTCMINYVNLIWENGLGGFDSYQFINPQQVLNFERVAFTMNSYREDAAGNYSDLTEGIYNATDRVITSNSRATVKVYSDALNDMEAFWIKSIFSSKQVYMELADFTLVPVILTPKSYQIQKTKYLRNSINQVEVEFILPDGYKTDF